MGSSTAGPYGVLPSLHCLIPCFVFACLLSMVPGRCGLRLDWPLRMPLWCSLISNTITQFWCPTNVTEYLVYPQLILTAICWWLAKPCAWLGCSLNFLSLTHITMTFKLLQFTEQSRQLLVIYWISIEEQPNSEGDYPVESWEVSHAPSREVGGKMVAPLTTELPPTVLHNTKRANCIRLYKHSEI